MSRKQRRQAAQSHSTGPVTPAGKQISSKNAIRHGLFAKTLVLAHEDESQFQQLADSYLTTFQPADPVECDLVEEMVAAVWRQRRLQLLEKSTLDIEIAAAGEDPTSGLAAAYEKKAKLLATFERCRTSYARQYSRALNNLLKLRASEPPSEAPPIQPQPVAPALKTKFQNEPDSLANLRERYINILKATPPPGEEPIR